MSENEWENEPDEEFWIDDKTGLECAIRRHPSFKHLCGYVGTPYELPEADAFNVHGGVTFNGPNEWANELTPNVESEFWVGFDCAHYMDYSPGMAHLTPSLKSQQTYRNWDYVKNEVASPAAQIKTILINKV